MIGLLATFGMTAVPVRRKPVVALLVTGSELVAPGLPLQPGQIYDTNTYALTAALRGWGLATSRMRVPDDLARVTDALGQALEAADVVIAVGGVSVGDCDYVKEACAALDVETRCWGVAVKPGKPFYFGTRTRGRKMVFGLPGNPVAALLGLRELVRPALFRQMGATDVVDIPLSAVLAGDLRKRHGRLELVRGHLEAREGRLFAVPTDGQESHMLGGLARADCLIHFPLSATELPAGAEVTVSLLDWG